MGADSVLCVLANSILQMSTWPLVFVRVLDCMGLGTPLGHTEVHLKALAVSCLYPTGLSFTIN